MEFGLIAATAADWPIVGQIAWVFGKLMDAIYNFLNLFGIQNIGICIILFTIIIYTLMIPLTIKQQKFSKMQSVMMPEIQKLQKKYAGKRDQASMLLLKHPKKVFSKEEIFEYAWEEAYMGETKTLDVHISNIRKKIKSVTSKEYIETIWGIGYRLHP